MIMLMILVYLFGFYITSTRVDGQAQIVPIIKKFSTDEFEQNPIGFAFTHFLDERSPRRRQRVYITPSSNKEDSALQEQDDYPSFDTVANKASDLLGGLFSIFDEKNRLPITPISTRPKKPVEQSVTPDPSSVDNAITLREHTCVRERRLRIPYTSSDYVNCVQFDKAVRCVSSGGNYSTVRIVECCEEYTTDNIRNGCIIDDSQQELSTVLSNYSNCIKSIPDDVFYSSTVFLPPNKYCEEKPLEIKDHTIKGIYHKYDLLNGQRLQTKGGGYVIAQEATERNKNAASLNCIEMNEVTAKDGVLFMMSQNVEASKQTLNDCFTSNPNFSIFKNLFNDEIRELFDSDTVTTVFAFSDDGFLHLSPSLQVRIREKRKCLKDLVKEHIFNGFYCSSHLNGSVINAISGNAHSFTRQLANGTLVIRIDNAKIIHPDQVYSNGIVHIIDDVIFDQKFEDWRDHLSVYEEDFLKLVDAAQPDEDKISALIVPPKETLKNIEDKKAFVLNHIVPQSNETLKRHTLTAFGSKIPSTLNGETLNHISETMIGCISLKKPSIRLCDTDIHFVEKPLPVVRESLLQLLKSRNDLKVFEKFFVSSSVAKEVDLDDPSTMYTLFLPSDDAFSKNQIRALQSNITMAEAFVKRHIFKEFFCVNKVDSAKINSVQNIQNEIYTLYKSDDKTWIGDSVIEKMDIVATNGIIQIIDNQLKSSDTVRRAPYRSILDMFTL